MKGFFHEIFKSVARIFSGYNLLWHLVAIVLTYALVASDFDWRYLQLTRSFELRFFLFPAVILGGIIPLFGILTFYAASAIRKNTRAINTAYALGQAALLGLFISDFYKAFTGRVGPPGFLTQDFVTDISHGFRFGFLRRGIFFGWPSTHTTIAFAMAIALFTLYPKNKPVRYLVIIYALYVGLGVSMTIHWFSDFAAGAVIGSVIGAVVGKSFRERYSLSKSR